MNKILKPRCCAFVGGGGWRSSQCSKTGKIERDGKNYCGIHDPVAVKAKNEKWLSDWQLKYESKKNAEKEAEAKRKDLERRAGCFDDLLSINIKLAKIVRELCVTYKTPLPESTLQRSDSVIAKATGETL